MSLEHIPTLDQAKVVVILESQYSEIPPRVETFIVHSDPEVFLASVSQLVNSANKNHARSAEFLVLAVEAGARFDFPPGHVFKSQGQTAEALRVTPPAVAAARKFARQKAERGEGGNCEFTVRGVRLVCMDDYAD